MDYRLGFTGIYISAVELGDKTPTLTIRDIQLEDVAEIKNGVETSHMKKRFVIYFEKTDRAWLLNRTNAEALNAMWGPNVTAWIGKRVTLHSQMVQVGTKRELGIRVKGSPDLEKDMTFMLILPRKKPTPYALTKTPTKEQAQPSATTEPQAT